MNGIDLVIRAQQAERLKKAEAEVARLTDLVARLQTDLATAKANWHAACHDIDVAKYGANPAVRRWHTGIRKQFSGIKGDPQ